MNVESQAIRRYYLSEEDLMRVAALAPDEQAEIDARLSKTFGADRVRLHVALINLRAALWSAFPKWLQGLLK